MLLARPALACAVALVLAMDVSGSVDAGEYRLQTEGLATALEDPAVRDVMLHGEVAVAVVQWSGLGQQELSIPWVRMRSAADVARLRDRVRQMPRAFRGGETGVGQAVAFAAAQFAAVPDCRERVIDLSGDGAENVGHTIGRARTQAHRDSIRINGLAIESMGLSITNFYRNWVITPGGFVVTAQGHLDFARAMRIKLLRELTVPSS